MDGNILGVLEVMNTSAPPFWKRFVPAHGGIRYQPEGPISIHIKNLSVAYPQHQVISHLSCHFEAPALWGIAGPNGAGKSTLLKTLLELQKPEKGEITFHGFCPCDVAYLAQQNQLDRRFPLTVGDTIAMGLFREVGVFQKYTKIQRGKMHEALEKVGLASFAKTPLQALSGGQFQRVLFARLILQNAPVIFLDEPFTGVDMQTIEDLMKLLQEWVTEGRLVIAVLHDLDLVQTYFPYTLLLARHFHKWGNTADVLTKENMMQALTASRSWEGMTGTSCLIFYRSFFGLCLPTACSHGVHRSCPRMWSCRHIVGPQTHELDGGCLSPRHPSRSRFRLSFWGIILTRYGLGGIPRWLFGCPFCRRDFPLHHSE
jgi:zinc/manganese transport system ATP-binding protein